LGTGNPELRQQIETYCRDVAIPVPRDIDKYHYSAVFISWCMRKAGATEAEFPATERHWEYVVRAVSDQHGQFLARNIESYAPQPGDLVNVSRGGKITFERARSAHYQGHSGVIVDIAFDKAWFVIGNSRAAASAAILPASGRLGFCAKEAGALCLRHRGAKIGLA
jgi:hypothetical protein